MSIEALLLILILTFAVGAAVSSFDPRRNL